MFRSSHTDRIQEFADFSTKWEIRQVQGERPEELLRCDVAENESREKVFNYCSLASDQRLMTFTLLEMGSLTLY